MSGMVTKFVSELKAMVSSEEMSDTAKNYFFDVIYKFEHSWEQRVSPDYDAMLKQKDEQLDLLQQIERLEMTANELRHEKQETIEHYESRLQNEKQRIKDVQDSFRELHGKHKTLKKLVILQAQVMVDQDEELKQGDF